MKKTIKHIDMVAILVKPGQDIIGGLTPESAHLWHMATGVSGEIGELLENLVLGDTTENLVEEFGDTEFYHQAIATALNFDTLDEAQWDEVPHTNIFIQLHLAVSGAALLDAAKKYAIYVKPLNRAEVVEQAGRVRYLLSRLYHNYGVTRVQALAHNVDKLYTSKKARYGKGKYSDKQAQARADKQE